MGLLIQVLLEFAASLDWLGSREALPVHAKMPQQLSRHNMLAWPKQLITVTTLD